MRVHNYLQLFVWYLLLHHILEATAKPSLRPAADKPKKNLLLLMSDDFGYEQSAEIDPNEHPFSRYLYENAVNFAETSAGTAVCAPSRKELISGRANGNPSWTTFSNNDVAELIAAGGQTIFGECAEQGYTSTTRGKIVHPNRDETMNRLQQYTQPSHPFDGKQNNECGQNKIACILERTIDMQIEASATALLTNISAKPFCLGVGFHNTHYPERSTRANYNKASAALPVQYTDFDLTAANLARIMQDQHLDFPIRGPRVNNVTQWKTNIHNFNAASKVVLKVPLKSGKFAFLSQLPNGYLNAQIDKARIRKFLRGATYSVYDNMWDIIQGLRRTGRLNDTIVVFTSDHGIGYGQIPYAETADRKKPQAVPGIISKNINLPPIRKVPFYVVIPGVTNVGQPGKKTYVPASLYDFYPTIYKQLFGKLPSAGNLAFDGKDLSPWLTNPTTSIEGIATISQYPRGPARREQNDPLMSPLDKGEFCVASKPDSGRREWCNLAYQMSRVIGGRKYEFHVAFPFYENRICDQPRFYTDPQQWQITQASCIDFSKPSEMMLFSDQATDLGQNLLFGNNVSQQTRQIADQMLSYIRQQRQRHACTQVPRRNLGSWCGVN